MKQLLSILITSTAALLSVPQVANADVVTDWNTIAVSTVSADRVNNRQTRDMAMVQAAVFDAMNAIRPYYTPAMVLITAKGYASREAAAAQAAHDVLAALFPAQQADLDAKLAASLAQIPDDDTHGHRPKYWGIRAGQEWRCSPRARMTTRSIASRSHRCQVPASTSSPQAATRSLSPCRAGGTSHRLRCRIPTTFRRQTGPRSPTRSGWPRSTRSGPTVRRTRPCAPPSRRRSACSTSRGQ